MKKIRFDRNFSIFAAVFFIITLIICIYYFSRIYQPWGTCWTDFTVFHRAGGRIISGEPIYNVADDTVNYGIDLYKYSPAFAYFMVPFTKMHMHKSVSLWYFLTFVLVLASIYFIKEIIARSNKEATLPKALYFISFALTLRFFLTHISRVQSDFLVLFFLSFSAWLLYTKREVLAGFALATGIMVKLTPLIFIPYLIYRKFYKAAVASIFGILFYLSVPALHLGWQKNLLYLKDWFMTLSLSTGDLMLWYKNQSLLGCIARLFSENSPVKLFVLPPLIIKGVFLLCSLIILFLILYFCKNAVTSEKKEFGYAHLLEFSLISICMVLFSPLGWKHTFLQLLVGHMVLVYYVIKHPKDLVVKILLIISFVLSSALNPDILKSYSKIVSLYSSITWGTLILIAAMLKVASRLKDDSCNE